MSVFISYVSGNKEHESWVESFAAQLRADGIESILDKWNLKLGESMPLFMERGVRENNYVLMICTPEYKKRFDERIRGVGYEAKMITGEALSLVDTRKFIPILRSGEWKDALPYCMLGIYSVDLRENNEEKYEEEYHNLLDTLHGIRKEAPPVGSPPQSRKFDEFKMNFLLDHLMGRAWNTDSGIIYEDGILVSEDFIKSILKNLEEKMNYTRNKYWILILTKSDIDKAIDSHIWKNGEDRYFYDKYERIEISKRCADQLQFRMAGYVGDDHIQHKVWNNGDIGFRYI